MTIKFKSIDDCIYVFLMQSQPSGMHGKVCFEGKSFYSWGYEVCRILDNRQALLLNIREIPCISPRRHVSLIARLLKGEINHRDSSDMCVCMGKLGKHTCIPVGLRDARKQVCPTVKKAGRKNGTGTGDWAQQELRVLYQVCRCLYVQS